jgi:DNA-binding XRE family transcriptional regulator
MSSIETQPGKPSLLASRIFVDVIGAFLEASESVQAQVREQVRIVKDPHRSEAEREQALEAVAQALLTAPRAASLGPVVPRDKGHVFPVSEAAQRRREDEEKLFAENLARLLKEKDLTQAELARRIGVRQPAISMMLSRRCRPQRRTVEKMARALGVEVRELWPL